MSLNPRMLELCAPTPYILTHNSCTTSTLYSLCCATAVGWLLIDNFQEKIYNKYHTYTTTYNYNNNRMGSRVGASRKKNNFNKKNLAQGSPGKNLTAILSFFFFFFTEQEKNPKMLHSTVYASCLMCVRKKSPWSKRTS